MYEGRHRAATEPTPAPRAARRPAWRLAAGAVGAVLALLVASPAAANPVVPVPAGATYSGLVARYCPAGTSWQALSFPGRDKNLIYAGESIDLRCTPRTGQASSSPASQQQATRPTTNTGWSNPVCATWFGDRIGAGRNHKGVDLGAPYGRVIRAAAAGIVSRGWQSGGAGNYITIAHGGVWTHYMHLNGFAVGHGQWVGAGQIIGYAGATGNATAPHLHFEVRTGGAWSYYHDPITFLANRGVAAGRC